MDIETLINNGTPRGQAFRIMDAYRKEERNKKLFNKISSEVEAIEESNLSSIKGIGASTAKTLISNNINTLEDLKAKNIDEIKLIIKSPIAIKSIEALLNNK